ncbi:MAG: DUF1028 domain-containing protein [Candidatus Bathyarchaeia archaeon]
MFDGRWKRRIEVDLESRLSTFSIVTYDPANGDLGVGVQSKYFSVGPVVPWAEAGVGAIATQAWVNVSYGPKGLTLLKEGLPVEEVIRILTENDEGRERRQLGVIDANGNSASYTGSECTPWAGSRQGENYSVQGNILEGEKVVVAMAEAFESSVGELAERLVAALEAGQEAGGDARGRQSAALLVVRDGAGRAGYGDKYIDLRVEDHRTPIRELRRLLNMNFSNTQAFMAQGLMEEGKADEAMDLAFKAVELSPENDNAHMALCRAKFETGDKPGAIEAFREAVNLNEKIASYVMRSPLWIFIAEDEDFLKGM